MKSYWIFPFLALFSASVFGQKDEKVQPLDSVLITSARIDLPFRENTRSITVITKEDITSSGVTNVADLLQQISGVDVRRRGLNGMQADLYIRGGSFDQTLLLIDGIKVDDAQTGHHTLNLALPIEVIERVEIIKGPAARVFGQNAFTGAINIVTKKPAKNTTRISAQGGSYAQLHAGATVSQKMSNASVLVHASRNTSEGYRYNTDFDNQNYFVKSRVETAIAPIEILANFQERKFGANGFYASPEATDQYEETQSSLIGVSTTFSKNRLQLHPQLYWRRNQDEYVFVRQDPSLYRNLHQTHKIGGALNGSYESKFGTSGFGVEVANVHLSSNNLGQRDRLMSTVFAEHRFRLFDNQLDLTPGVALNYFSDFKFHAFPGLDAGFYVNEHFKVYGNVGYTYRVPTYTDLFYTDPTTRGNENLQPETAFAHELGVTYNKSGFRGSMALFNRNGDKLIDYVKEEADDLWQAENLREVNTRGLEANAQYAFTWMQQLQSIQLGYTFIEDTVESLPVSFSQYAMNSLKHHVTATLKTRFLKRLSQTVVYKYAQRTNGQAYSVYDAGINYQTKHVEVSLLAANIFNESYTETNLVPMPKGNVLLGLTYIFQ